MAYEPKTWVCGEYITADALNHMEEGIADCCGGGTEPLILTLGGTTQEEADDALMNGMKLSETWETINTAFRAGRRIIAVMNPYIEQILANTVTITVLSVIGGNGVIASKPTVLCSWGTSTRGTILLTCDTANDYPRASTSSGIE